MTAAVCSNRNSPPAGLRRHCSRYAWSLFLLSVSTESHAQLIHLSSDTKFWIWYFPIVLVSGLLCLMLLLKRTRIYSLWATGGSIAFLGFCISYLNTPGGANDFGATLYLLLIFAGPWIAVGILLFGAFLGAIKKLQYPEKNSASASAGATTLTIMVSARGYEIGGEIISGAALTQAIVAKRAKIVEVHADRLARYEQVEQAISSVREAGATLNLAAAVKR